MEVKSSLPQSSSPSDPNSRLDRPRRKTIMEKQQDEMSMYYSTNDQPVSGMSLLTSGRRSMAQPSGSPPPPPSTSPVAPAVQAPVAPAPAAQAPTAPAPVAPAAGNAVKPKIKPNIKMSTVVVPSGTVSTVTTPASSQNGAGTMEGIEMALVELLASIPMSTEDIWEGDPELFPVLFQFKESFVRLSPDANGPSTYNVLTFNLPLSHFPVGKKRFRVNRNLPTSSLVRLLCTKMNVPNPERFSLYSLKGYKLNPNEPLVSYGFGPLFKTWELNVRKNPELNDDDSSEEAVARMLIETPVALPTESEAVVLTFPPLVELAGLQRKTFRISKDELLLPICELIKRLWAKLGVTGPEKFTFLASGDDSSSQQQQKWFVLDTTKTLANYGLGWRFHGWDLKVVFTDLANESETIKLPMESYGWASIQKSSPTIKEALLIASILDKRISELKAEMPLAGSPNSQQQQQDQTPQNQQQQQQNSADSDAVESAYKQKLADVEKLLGEMEAKLMSAESELKVIGDPKHELELLTERYNQLEGKYNDLFKRATAIPAGIQARCTLAEERLLATQAECEKYRRMYLSQKVQNDALVAYALKTSRVSEIESEDVQRKAVLDHNTMLMQENSTLKENNLLLTQENAKLNERVRELQSKLDVILESLCKNPASVASTPNVTPSSLLSAASSSPLPSSSPSSSSPSSGTVVTTTPTPLPIKTARRTSSPSVASLVTAHSTSSPADESSPKVGLQHPTNVAGELHKIRESIHAAQKMSFAAQQPRQKVQQKTPPPFSVSVQAGDVAARHQSIPLTASEKQQLLKRINDQKETMIRTNRGSYDPRAIASRASLIYAGLTTKFSEDQYGSTEDLKGEL